MLTSPPHGQHMANACGHAVPTFCHAEAKANRKLWGVDLTSDA